ncbi:MAG: hypothetical protein E6J74_34315 [Deltaproteobacteria bacterium]|nr:MAG: hypothetical protein E6J74_34315 [Deltaproteobacteria bacterium]
MVKRLSAATALFIVFAFLSVSIAHACSGLALVGAVVQQSPMNMGGGNPPCSKNKGDICQSVRDSILSVKPSISAAGNPQQTVPPLQISIDNPIQLVYSPAAPVIESAFHPVFKLPLTLSYLVLRI